MYIIKKTEFLKLVKVPSRKTTILDEISQYTILDRYDNIIFKTEKHLNFIYFKYNNILKNNWINMVIDVPCISYNIETIYYG